MSQPVPIQPLKVLLPDELKKRLEPAIKRRLATFKIVPQLDVYPLRKGVREDGSIKVALPHQLPGGIRRISNLNKVRDLYLVRGPSLWNRVRFGEEDLRFPDQRRDRYQLLQQEIGLREKRKNFLRLIYQQLSLQEKIADLQEEREIVKELQALLVQLRYEAPYWKGLDQIFEEAVAEVTGITTLEGIMKGLMHILVVDDLGDRTLTGLADQGYKRKFLKAFTLRELTLQYRRFQRDNPKSKFSLFDFLGQAEPFQEFDLILVNQWDLDQHKFQVRLGVRKKAILSKKEEAMVKRQDTIQDDIEKLQKDREDLKNRLRKTLEDLQEIEALDLETIDGTTEKKYLRLRKVRTRLVEDLKRKTLKLRELQRPVNAKSEISFRDFDLYHTMMEPQSFQRWMQSQVDGIGSIFGGASKREPTAIERMLTLAEVVRQIRKETQQLLRLQQTVEKLEEQLNTFATEQGLTTGKQTYQDVLDEHLLDKLEYIFLGGLLAQELAQAAAAKSSAPSPDSQAVTG